MKALFHESESMIFKQFLINFNFDFGFKAQKYLKTYVNDVLQFKFFSLNLSSKFPVGVIIRTSKCPYMDIFDMYGHKQIFQIHSFVMASLDGSFIAI